MNKLFVIAFIVSLVGSLLSLGITIHKNASESVLPLKLEHDIRIACIQSGREIEEGKCVLLLEH